LLKIHGLREHSLEGGPSLGQPVHLVEMI